MVDTKAITQFIDSYLEKHTLSHITPIEGNRLLQAEGLLNDSSSHPGKPLRDLLRAGEFPHAIQPGGFNTEWFILHSQLNIYHLTQKQHLIWSYINERVKILEQIYNGYKHDISPINDYPILIESAFQYYRTIVIDLCALFGKTNSSKSRFSLVWNEIRYRRFVNESAIKHIRQIIEIDKAVDITRLIDLRDTEYSHHDFKQGVKINVNFDYYDIVMDLHKTAFAILDIIGSNISPIQTGFDDNGSASLYYLNELLNDLSNS